MQLTPSRPSTPRSPKIRRYDERGVMMVVALAVATVTLLLSTVAITETINGITQSGIAAKQVSSVDAAEAGIQYELSQITANVKASASSFSCAATTPLGMSGAYRASYSLRYAMITNSAAGTTPTATPVACSGSVSLQSGTNYLIVSTGTTTAGVVGSRTLKALIYVPSGVTYAKSSSYVESLFAGVDIEGGGSFSLSGGGTYTGYVGDCGSDWTYGGDYYASGGSIPSPFSSSNAPSTFTGACRVSGNLYVNNTNGVTITEGSGVGGSVFSGGPVSLSGGAGIANDLWATGAVDLSGTVGGNIDAGGNVSLTSATVNGAVYSTGSVSITSGTYNNIFANGKVTIDGGANVQGTIYSTGGVQIPNGTVHAIEDQSGPSTSVTYAGAGNGPLYYAGGVTVSYPSWGGPTSKSTTIPPGFPLPVQATTISNTVATAMVTAANEANGTTTGTTPTVSFPTLNYDQASWLNNSTFCGAARCTTSTMNFYADGTNCSLLQQQLQAMTITGVRPTVIQTSCQVSSSVLGYGALALQGNLAIFDSSGFDFPTSFGGIQSGDGNSHQFFAIVPSSAYATSSSLPSSEMQCDGLTGPDINVTVGLTDSSNLIQDFLYTPASVCSTGGNGTVNGRVYAGQLTNFGSNYHESFYDIAPFAAQTGGSGGSTAGTPVVEWVKPS